MNFIMTFIHKMYILCEAESVVLAGLEFTVETRLALNLWQSLPSWVLIQVVPMPCHIMNSDHSFTPVISLFLGMVV